MSMYQWRQCACTIPTLSTRPLALRVCDYLVKSEFLAGTYTTHPSLVFEHFNCTMARAVAYRGQVDCVRGATYTVTSWWLARCSS